MSPRDSETRCRTIRCVRMIMGLDPDHHVVPSTLQSSSPTCLSFSLGHDVFTLTGSDSFLSFVPSIVYLSFALPRLTYLLVRRKPRRLLPLSKVPLSGLILLTLRITFALCLVGADSAVWVTWEKTDGLKGSWSGWVASAFGLFASVCSIVLYL